MNSRSVRSGIVWLLILGALLVIVFQVTTRQPARTELSLQKLVTAVKAGEVRKLVVQGDDVTVVRKSGVEEASRKEPRVSIVESLKTLGVTSDEVKNVEVEVVA